MAAPSFRRAHIWPARLLLQPSSKALWPWGVDRYMVFSLVVSVKPRWSQGLGPRQQQAQQGGAEENYAALPQAAYTFVDLTLSHTEAERPGAA